MNAFIKWWTGGAEYHYHNLFHCMDNDLVSIALVVILCVGVFSGYLVIAYRWSKASNAVPDSDAKKGLNDLKWLFILCGVCSYLWVILELVWPAWRFYMLLLFLVNIVTWRYVIRGDAMSTLYQYLKDRDDLVKEIEEKKAEIERLKRAS